MLTRQVPSYESFLHLWWDLSIWRRVDYEEFDSKLRSLEAIHTNQGRGKLIRESVMVERLDRHPIRTIPPKLSRLCRTISAGMSRQTSAGLGAEDFLLIRGRELQLNGTVRPAGNLRYLGLSVFLWKRAVPT